MRERTMPDGRVAGIIPIIYGFRLVTVGRMRDGVEGVRDVDAPCEGFRIGAPSGDCDSDGHYICQECKHLSKRKTPAGIAVELDALSRARRPAVTWRKARSVRPGDGPVAHKLRELLSAQGFRVTLLMPVSGHWKKRSTDVYRWQAHAVFEGREVNLSCWDTMTECVRRGITVDPEDPRHLFGINFDVWAKS